MQPKQFIRKVENQFISSKGAARELGNIAQERMRANIKESLQRDGSTGALSDSIKVHIEDVGKVRIVGVGKIAEMNTMAPYWYIVNYGGLGGAAKHGKTIRGYYGTMIAHGQPRADLRGANIAGGKGATEAFHSLASGGYRMTPKAPIWPHNYIEKTANWASTVYRIHYAGALRRTSISTI